MNLRQRRRSLTLGDESAHAGQRSLGDQSASKSGKLASAAEGEGFEPSVDPKAHNVFDTAPSTSSG
jgi:hypothetical protein